MSEANAQPGFESDIRPLFREKDQRTMKWAFDLWNYDDVRSNADGILERLKDGTMPCDGEWTPEQISVLQRWVTNGMPS